MQKSIWKPNMMKMKKIENSLEIAVELLFMACNIHIVGFATPLIRLYV